MGAGGLTQAVRDVLIRSSPEAVAALRAQLAGVATEKGEGAASAALALALLEVTATDPEAAANCEARWHGVGTRPSLGVAGPAAGASLLAATADPCADGDVICLYINGLNTTLEEADQEAIALTRGVAAAGSGMQHLPIFQLHYNWSIAESPLPLLCPLLTLKWLLAWDVWALGHLFPYQALFERASALAQNCRTWTGRLGDFMREVIPQLVTRLLPSAIQLRDDEVSALRETIRVALAPNGTLDPARRVLIAAHSQGNLLTELAVSGLSADYAAQVGIVSIASPIVVQPAALPRIVRTVMVEGDVLTAIAPQSPPPTVANELSRALDDAPTLLRLQGLNGGEFPVTIEGRTLDLSQWELMSYIHGLQTGYLAYPESAHAVTEAVFDVLASLGVENDGGFWSSADESGALHVATLDGSPLTLAMDEIHPVMPGITLATDEGLFAVSPTGLATAIPNPVSATVMVEMQATLRHGVAQRWWTGMPDDPYLMRLSGGHTITTGPLSNPLLAWGVNQDGRFVWLSREGVLGNGQPAGGFTLHVENWDWYYSVDSSQFEGVVWMAGVVDQEADARVALLAYRPAVDQHELWLVDSGVEVVPIPDSSNEAMHGVTMLSAQGSVCLSYYSGPSHLSSREARTWSGSWSAATLLSPAGEATGRLLSLGGAGGFLFAHLAVGRQSYQVRVHTWSQGVWRHQWASCEGEPLAAADLGFGVGIDPVHRQFAVAYSRIRANKSELLLRTLPVDGSGWSAPVVVQRLDALSTAISPMLAPMPGGIRGGWAVAWTALHGEVLGKTKLAW